MNIFLGILTALLFFLMAGEDDENKQSVFAQVFYGMVVAMVFYNLLKIFF